MDISSLLNTNAVSNPGTKTSKIDPMQVALNIQASFSRILGNLTSDQSSKNNNDSANSEFSGLFKGLSSDSQNSSQPYNQLSDLLGNTNSTSNSSTPSDGLDIATLTKQIEAGDTSPTTLQYLLYAYERDRWNTLSSTIAGKYDETDSSRNSLV